MNVGIQDPLNGQFQSSEMPEGSHAVSVEKDITLIRALESKHFRRNSPLREPVWRCRSLSLRRLFDPTRHASCESSLRASRDSGLTTA